MIKSDKKIELEERLKRIKFSSKCDEECKAYKK